MTAMTGEVQKLLANAVVVKPGDILIIGINEAVSADALQSIADGLRKEVPEDIRVCVVNSVAGFAVVPAQAPTTPLR